MDISWMTAFIDLPAERLDAGVAFWEGVTRSTRSAWRGDDDEFATLLPPTGDAHLRVQRVADGNGGVHLDLHVADVVAATGDAEAAGATVIADRGHVLMSSPAGFVFCLVEHHGEVTVSEPVDPARPYAVDQVCIDIPAAQFDAECAFWARLTGWEAGAGSRKEFAYLVRRPGLPLRLLLQRLGDDDLATTARGHLDLAGGEHRAAIAATHRDLGAAHVADFERWIVMRDPGGLLYCVTGRDPETGTS